MNTVIFLTKDNKADMEVSISLLAEAQITKVNGALIVVHQTNITSKEARRISGPLVPKFVNTSAVECSANTGMSHDAQLAAMFSRFIMLAYSRFPGPWLVIDEPSAPLVSNWAEASARLHRTYGGKSCGLADRDGQTLLSHGPTTLQISPQAAKLFRFSTNESWRSRGRYLLVNSGFKQIKPEDAVFCGLNKIPLEDEVLKTPEGGFRSVFITDKPEYTPTAEPVINPEWVDAKDFVEVPDEKTMLIAKIESATGKAPHHFTGIDKLRKMAQDLNQPAQA